jgi:DNA-binding beta-propeller fold protein YncE
MDDSGGGTMNASGFLFRCRLIPRACAGLMLVGWLLCGVSARGESLEPVGVLGNSGVAGDSLVRVNTLLKSPDGQGLRSGGFVDGDARVWLSGGDAINCLDFEGRLLNRYPLEPGGRRVDTTAFAALDGVLYFFGHLDKPDPKTRSDVALFALPMAGNGRCTVAATVGEIPGHTVGVLSAMPRGGKLVYAYAAEQPGGKRIVIAAFDPTTKIRETLLEVAGVAPSGLAVSRDGQSVYLGGNFGLYIGANHHHPNASEIVHLDWQGKTLWRRVCLDTPAEPTQFRGVVSPAGGAVWDTAWYGFLARFDSSGKSAPGKIASWDMRIPYVAQVIDLRDAMGLLPAKGVAETLDPLLLTQTSPEQAHLAVWNDDAKSLELTRRFGSLPELGNVALNADGWVNVGGLWWRFDDVASAAPAFANHAGACSPAAWRDDWACSLTLGDRAIPCTARPAFGRGSAALDHGSPAPFSKVRGFAVAPQAGGGEVRAFATESGSNRIWRSTMEPRTWSPRKDWKSLECGSVKTPGDIAVLGDGSLVVVDGGSIVKLEASGDTLTERARLAKWGDKSGESFGKELRLAADGGRILVADTDRHRVVLVDAASMRPKAQCGSTDSAGAGNADFDSPTAVALAGDKAVVADRGNQRIVKLRLRAN